MGSRANLVIVISHCYGTRGNKEINGFMILLKEFAKLQIKKLKFTLKYDARVLQVSDSAHHPIIVRVIEK
jgi:hypothetical protein